MNPFWPSSVDREVRRDHDGRTLAFIHGFETPGSSRFMNEAALHNLLSGRRRDAGARLLRGADLSRLDIVADVYETDLSRLTLGAIAEIIVPGEGRRFTATLREIGWQVRRAPQTTTDPVAAIDSRTVAVRLALDEAGVAALARRSNMQVQVAIRP